MSAETVGMTFEQALWQAIQDYPTRVRWIDRWRVRRAMRRPEWRLDVEAEAVQIGVAAGAILPGNVDPKTGALVGDWQSFIQMLIDNLPAILEFIAGLFAIFAMI